MQNSLETESDFDGSIIEQKSTTDFAYPLSKITQLIPGVIYQYQVFPDGSSRVPFASEGIFDTFELKPHDVIDDASKIYERILEEDFSKFSESITISLNNLSKWELDFRVKLPSKGVRWLRGVSQPEKLNDGSVIWHGYITDVTERKLAARALIQKEQRWHFALESSEEGIWDYNFNETSFYLSNKLIEKLGYRYKPGRENAIFWFEKIHPEDLKKFKIDIFRHIRGDTEMFVNENRMRCKDGSYRWILHKGKMIEWLDNGKPLRMIGTHSDITEKKEKELQLEQTIDLVSEQNSRLSNFAYIVSHNLRTHTGNLEVLIDFIENAETEEEQKIEFEYLKSVSSQLSETILHLNEVLSIQTSINSNLKSINLFLFAEKARNTLLLQIEEKNALIENLIPDDLVIDYNPAYMESILYNFISNALKYSHPLRQPVIKLSCIQQNKNLILSISDNGMGINLNRFKSDIFGMYKTFHGNKNARGIGLFITKNQIEAMGGKVEVKSIENEGTTFNIFIKA